MRIAESVLLTCWPPAPDARNVSMRSSAGLSSTASISSSSGRIATVHGGGVDAALRFGRGHALHAMRAGLELEMRERAVADDAADDFLVAAVLAGALRQHFDAPALLVGVARVHAEQIAGEDRRFVAAGARAHFEVDVAVVARVLRQQQLRELFLFALQPRVEAGQLFAAELAQLVVRAFGHFLRGSALGEQRRGTRDSASTTGSRREYSIDSSRNLFVSAITPGSASRSLTSSCRSASLSSFLRIESFIQPCPGPAARAPPPALRFRRAPRPRAAAGWARAAGGW